MLSMRGSGSLKNINGSMSQKTLDTRNGKMLTQMMIWIVALVAVTYVCAMMFVLSSHAEGVEGMNEHNYESLVMEGLPPRHGVKPELTEQERDAVAQASVDMALNSRASHTRLRGSN
jgi:hypothetical protein